MGGDRPVLPADVHERFLAARGTAIEYEACLGARVRSHFVDARAGLDAWTDAYHLVPYAGRGPSWESAEVCSVDALELLEAPAPGATFRTVPAGLVTAKAQQQQARALADAVYRTSTMSLYRCAPLKVTSAPGESESEFRARLALQLREKRDAAVDALRRKYASKIDTIADRERRAAQKLEREQDQASSETMTSALRVGGSLLGALFGGGRGRSSAFGKAATAARSVGRVGKERSDVEHAEADLAALREQGAALEAELEREIDELQATHDPASLEVETVEIKPRKSDIEVSDLALVWRPA
jgi:hypothetical protein